MSRDFVPFALERMMSVWENQVDYNLSESGILPITTDELVEDPKLIEDLFSTGLNYPQSNGILELRENIAALYPGATPDDVIVTTGAAQANFTTLWTLMEPDDEIVVMLPNYLQIWGIAQNFGLKLKTFTLKEELNWAADVGELDRTVTDQTKLIAVCNPNNPSPPHLLHTIRSGFVPYYSSAEQFRSNHFWQISSRVPSFSMSCKTWLTGPMSGLPGGYTKDRNSPLVRWKPAIKSSGCCLM